MNATKQPSTEPPDIDDDLCSGMYCSKKDGHKGDCNWEILEYWTERGEREEARIRAETTLRDLFGFVADGTLVRNTARDGEPGWPLRALRLVMALKAAAEVLGITEDPPPATGPEVPAPAPDDAKETP